VCDGRRELFREDPPTKKKKNPGIREEPPTEKMSDPGTVLGRVPKVVIRNGEVIQVRSDLEKRLRGTSCSPTRERPTPNAVVTIETEASRWLESQSTEEAKSSIASGRGAVVRLQVRWLDRSKLVVPMFETQTIGDLRQLLVTHGTSLGEDVDMFEIRNAYPQRLLNDALTLTEAGLVPNGTVHTARITGFMMSAF